MSSGPTDGNETVDRRRNGGEPAGVDTLVNAERHESTRDLPWFRSCRDFSGCTTIELWWTDVGMERKAKPTAKLKFL